MSNGSQNKLLKTLRLDQSDDFVFEHSADAGEWAVSGAFEYADSDPAALSPKQRLAFAQGFLGLASFGRSTVVSVSSASDTDIAAVTDALAAHLMQHYGAPSIDAARAAATEEIAFVLDLCAPYPVNQLLLVEREMTDDGIREGFRAAEKPDRLDHAKIWTIVPEDEAVT